MSAKPARSPKMAARPSRHFDMVRLAPGPTGTFSSVGFVRDVR